MEDDPLAVVLDVGSGACKVGFSGEHAAREVFPTIVGRYRFRGVMVGMGQRDFYVGHEAHSKRGKLTIKHPIENGVVVNWDDLEKIWHHSFYNELRVAPEEHPVLLSEVSFALKSSREKTAQIMFETFNIPALYLANQAALSLCTTGSTTGVVLQSGEEITHVVPIYEGYALGKETIRLDFGGRHITDSMIAAFNERGIDYSTTAERLIVETIKETYSYVALDYEEEMKACSPDGKESKHNRDFELPDGNIVTVGSERFRCAEALFNPALISKGATAGIHKAIYDSVMKCDKAERKLFFGNILLAGGNTMFGGIEERVSKEMELLAPDDSIEVRAPRDRMYLSWLGGSMLSSLPTFKRSWFMKDEYDEIGPSLIHRKCF